MVTVYILRCRDGSFYTGITDDLAARLAGHELGVDKRAYTFARRPVCLVWSQEFPTHEAAFAAERQIKGWTRAKKLALIENRLDDLHELVRQERLRRERVKQGEK